MNSIESTTEISGHLRQEELSNCWDSLALVLDREIAVYRELSELCLQERDVLVKQFSAQHLLENNSRKETILLKAKMIDESRVKLVGRISELLGISAEGVDLTTLIGYADAATASVLRDLQRRLRTVLEDVNDRNDQNKDLLNSSILYVQKSIDFISRLVASQAGYGTDGELKVAGTTGRIVCRKE